MAGVKVGICEWVFPVHGLDAMRWAARLGFDGIQIAERGGYEAGYPLLDPELQTSYYQLQQETGIEIQALHLWSLCRLACMIHPLDSEAGKLGLDYLRKAVQCCQQMKIRRLMLTSGFLCQIKNKRDFDIFAQYLSYACHITEDSNIQLVFESALTADEILLMCQKVPGLKICFDLFNPLRFAFGNPVDEIQRIGIEHIDHFHTKDGPANMVGCTLLGEGVGRYHEVISLIHDMKYEGWLMSENYYNAPPIIDQMPFDEAAKCDLKTMRRLQ